MFTRWLEVWGEATSEMLPPAMAITKQVKAGRIGESLQLALALRNLEERADVLNTKPPSRPYRSLPVFDQDTVPAALRWAHSTKAGT